jgi:hypothetical protein
MPFDSIVITKVFAAADEVTEVLRLDGPSGVLQEGGQSLTLEITGAAITAGALVLERARAGRGGYLPLAVFTANQAPLRFFSRSRLSYDYRVRASEDFVGGATVTLSEVDDVQRELPKPDSRPYLILLDSGIQLPVGQNLVMYSPSEIIRDGLPYEGYGISNPQPATDGDCGSGSFLRFDDSGNLEGQVMTGATFNIDFCSGANLNVNAAGALQFSNPAATVGVDAAGALMFANAAGSASVDSLGQFNYTGPGAGFSIAASGAWQLSNGLAVMTASAAGDLDFSSPVATLHLDDATGATLSNPAGASIGFDTAGEVNVTAAGSEWARLRNSFGAVEVQDDGTIQLLTPVAALGVQANGLISMSNGDSTLQLGTGANGFYYIGDPNGTPWIFDITPLGAIGFNSDYGMAGYVPVSAGPGAAVTWVDPNTLVSSVPDLYRDNAVGETTPVATGTNAVAIGDAAVSSGLHAFALGQRADASGDYSIAFGGDPANNLFGARAQAGYSIAIGPDAVVESLSSNGIAIGRSSSVSFATNGIAIGYGAQSTQADVIAIGRAAIGASESVVIGGTANGNASSTVTIGYGAVQNGIGVSVGYASQAGAFGAALGYSANAGTAVVQGATALGNLATATASGAIAIGYAASATGVESIAIGTDGVAGPDMATASGLRAIAIGRNANANATDALALGQGAEATAVQAVAVGVGVVNATTNTAEFGSSNTNKLRLDAAGKLSLIGSAPVMLLPQYANAAAAPAAAAANLGGLVFFTGAALSGYSDGATWRYVHDNSVAA